VHRLFSSFPNGLPGTGLLLLRLSLAGTLLADAAAKLAAADFALILLYLGEILAGTLLSIGLWTPLVAVLVCLLQLVMALSDGAAELYLLRAAVGLCIALLGPGAWSIDARLFGRRRVEIKNLRSD
jgi:putative oxidoreductase